MHGKLSLLDFANFMVILVFSTALHELTHAWLATRFGDDTPARHGRLTFNPIPHLDPFFSVLLPAAMFWTSGGFMAAAWTPVNPFKMRRPRLHGFLTALGGPTTNFLLAGVAFLCFAAIIVVGGAFDARQLESGGWDLSGLTRGQRVALLAFEMNVLLGVLNFIPIPPLDGGAVIPLLLPNRYQRAFWTWRRYSWIVFAGLLLTGALEAVLAPAMDLSMDLAMEGGALVKRVFLG